MKKMIIKSLLIALTLFLFQSLLGSLIFYAFNKTSGYYGWLGGLVYAFILFFWLYWLLTFVYMGFARSAKNRVQEYFIAFFVVLIGYIIAGYPNAIDGDFEQFMNLQVISIYLLLIPFLVELNRLILPKA